jgi:hypothetical protein
VSLPLRPLALTISALLMSATAMKVLAISVGGKPRSHDDALLLRFPGSLAVAGETDPRRARCAR